MPGEEDEISALRAELSLLGQEITAAEQENNKYTGGLVKSLIAVRLEILRTTRAIVEQRIQVLQVGAPVSVVAHITTADPERAAALGEEMVRLGGELATAQADAARFSGGLVHSLKQSTVATLQQTMANLRQQHVLAKFGLLLPKPDLRPVDSDLKGPLMPEAVGDQTPVSQASAPKALFEITEVATRPTESNRIWTRYAWKASVRSLAAHALLLSLTVDFLDSGGFVIDQDRKFDLPLGVGSSEVFTGFKMINAASAKKVATINVKIKAR